MANNLGRLRAARKWTQQHAAEALGTTRNQYAKLENGSRRLTEIWIDRAALAYGVDPSAIVQGSFLPSIVGLLLGDGHVQWKRDHQFGDGRDVSLQVKDNALGLQFADCLLLIENRAVTPTTADVGRLALVTLKPETSSVLRRICAGTRLDRYHLIGMQCQPEFDVEVVSRMRISGIRFR